MEKLNILVHDVLGPWANATAIGMHEIGHNVSISQLDSHTLVKIVESKLRFDFVFTRDTCVKSWANIMANNPSIIWKDLFNAIVIFQFHDSVQEGMAIESVKDIFAKNGINLHYWTYCKNSLDFLDKFGIIDNYFYAKLPIEMDFDIYAENKSEFIYDVSTLITKKKIVQEPHTLMEPSKKTPTILYMGQAKCGFPYQGLESYVEKISSSPVGDFLREKKEWYCLNRLNFIEKLLENNLIDRNGMKTSEASKYMCVYSGWVVQKVRQTLCGQLKEIFNDDFIIYGDHWDSIGIKSNPSDYNAHDKYKHALISIDFGSMFIDTSIYNRTIEITQAYGRLMQLEQPYAKDDFGDFYGKVSFRSTNDLMDKIDYAIKNEDDYHRFHENFREFIKNTHNSASVCRNVIDILRM